jgi:hypothetical protein
LFPDLPQGSLKKWSSMTLLAARIRRAHPQTTGGLAVRIAMWLKELPRIAALSRP